MEGKEYQRLAMVTLNKELSETQILENAVMGLCGESGECVDLVKKHLFQGHELDKEKLIKECGDVLWYCAELAHYLGVSLDEIMEGNIAKLKRRYPEGFEAEKSVHRTQD